MPSDRDFLREKLTISNIFAHYGHDVQTLPSERNSEESRCTSPFSQSSDAHFYFDDSTKQFEDYTTGQKGDYFTLIANFEKKDVKSSFPAILAKAEKNCRPG